VSWHRGRRKAIYEAHPEVEKLTGDEWKTVFILGALVIVHTAMAIAVGHKGGWWWLPVSYTFGAFAAFGLQALTHEASHQRPYSTLKVVVIHAASLPCNFIWQHYYLVYHHKHHAYTGTYCDHDGSVLFDTWHRPFQPTMSYSGSAVWNLLNFNELSHVEHHDFPAIPWTRIHRLAEIAPEFYAPLQACPSVLGVIWQWLSSTNTEWSKCCDFAGRESLLDHERAKDAANTAIKQLYPEEYANDDSEEEEDDDMSIPPVSLHPLFAKLTYRNINELRALRRFE